MPEVDVAFVLEAVDADDVPPDAEHELRITEAPKRTATITSLAFTWYVRPSFRSSLERE